MKRFVTRALIVVVATLGIVFAQFAPASATTTKKLESNLAALWTTVLETPKDQNPFGGVPDPAAFACFDLGHSTVAPFAGGPTFSCTVKTGTKLFIVGFSTECSTFDDDCGRETNPNGCKGTTAEELLQCAIDADAVQAGVKVTLDGRDVPLTEVKTPGLKIVLPADNIFGEPAGKEGLSSAHGKVALLNPLTPGTHTIKITDNNDVLLNTTTIVVKPGL
jgi:hypothetical protein